MAGPATSGILADWGADVVKIEAPPAGDRYRAFYSAAAGMPLPINPMFELDNRGKRSIVVDLRRPEGQEIALRAIAAADVFITNIRPGALERAALDPATLLARFPRLIYALATGYGVTGVERDRAAYDAGAFWGRAGSRRDVGAGGRRAAVPTHRLRRSRDSAFARRRHRRRPLRPRAQRARAPGHHLTLAHRSLHHRRRHQSGVPRLGIPPIPLERTSMPNPLCTFYRAQDGRWIFLLGLQADRHWPDLVRAVDKPEWLDDPRYTNIKTRREHFAALIADLDAIFATSSFSDGAERLDRAGMWWAALQTVEDAVRDPQVEACGAFIDVPVGDSSARMLATPVDFGDHRPAAARSGTRAGRAHRGGAARSRLRLGRDRRARRRPA